VVARRDSMFPLQNNLCVARARARVGVDLASDCGRNGQKLCPDLGLSQ
jgi:hypothetical protein